MSRVRVPHLFLSLSFWFLFMCTAASAETLVVPMKYRTAVEALPMVKELLSSQGRAVADPRTNALLIADNEASIQRIREFLAGFDRLGEQGRIRIKFQETGSREEQSAEAGGRISGGDWSAAAGRSRRRDGIDVRLEDRAESRSGTSEFSVVTVSGSSAYITVGEDLLFTERWLDLTRRYARVTETVSIHRIATGMEVTATFLKNYADVEIIPRISGIEGGVIRFTEAATRLQVPYGQWVTIGGTSRHSSEVIQEILARGRGERSSAISISLLVEPVNT